MREGKSAFAIDQVFVGILIHFDVESAQPLVDLLADKARVLGDASPGDERVDGSMRRTWTAEDCI